MDQASVAFQPVHFSQESAWLASSFKRDFKRLVELDHFFNHVITERQAEARFVARQKCGNPARGLRVCLKIERGAAAKDFGLVA